MSSEQNYSNYLTHLSIFSSCIQPILNVIQQAEIRGINSIDFDLSDVCKKKETM